MNFIKLNILLLLCTTCFVRAQDLSVEQMTFLTPLWEGARFDDGRPRVADDILNRMKQVSIEEAWGVLRNEGYTTNLKVAGNPSILKFQWWDEHLLYSTSPIVRMWPSKSSKKEKPRVQSEIQTHGLSINWWKEIFMSQMGLEKS